MTIKKKLESYRALRIDADRLKRVYIELHADIGGGGIRYDGMPKGTRTSKPTEADALRLADACIDYANKLAEATTRMLEIERLIQRVSDPRGRYVLWEHYINFRSIDDIGYDEQIDRCGRQARRYHDNAIAELEALYNA